MKIAYKYIFNFSVTHTGGGLKRLYEYSKWFNNNGGAWFIIHPNCNSVIKTFPNNHYFVVSQISHKRIFNDCSYLPAIEKEIGQPDFYYSYGIPIYYRFGKVNWFHLSNILPLYSKGIPLSFFDKYIKFNILGWKLKKNYINADIISAESLNSLAFVEINDPDKLLLSVNGSDDEIKFIQNKFVLKKDDIATVVGTQSYKSLVESYHIFEMLKANNNKLKLVVIGNKDSIPKKLKGNENIIATGVISQGDVIEYLKKTKYYISTTSIENSYNAASEGVVFADESYISDIGPHRELLKNESYDLVSVLNLKKPIIHVKENSVTGTNLKSWDEIISETIDMVDMKLNKIDDIVQND